jgi:hypothetical protein
MTQLFIYIYIYYIYTFYIYCATLVWFDFLSKQVLFDTDVNGATAMHHVSCVKLLQTVRFWLCSNNYRFLLSFMCMLLMVFVRAGNYIRQHRHCAMAQKVFRGVEFEDT